MANTLDKFLETVPTVDELRSRLAENQRERALLKKLIQIAGQKENLRAEREPASCK